MVFYFSSLILQFKLYNSLGNKSNFFRICIYTATFGSLLFYQEIITFISNYILKDTYYLHYAQNEIVEVGIGILLSFSPTVILGMFFNKKFNSINSSYKFYFFLVIVGFILKLFPYFGINYLNRIADYFIVATTWLVPYYYRILIKKRDTFAIALFLIIFLIIIWFFTYVFTNAAETVPYTTIFSS